MACVAHALTLPHSKGTGEGRTTSGGTLTTCPRCRETDVRPKAATTVLESKSCVPIPRTQGHKIVGPRVAWPILHQKKDRGPSPPSDSCDKSAIKLQPQQRTAHGLLHAPEDLNPSNGDLVALYAGLRLHAQQRGPHGLVRAPKLATYANGSVRPHQVLELDHAADLLGPGLSQRSQPPMCHLTSRFLHGSGKGCLTA
jgi:hypothetical protein